MYSHSLFTTYMNKPDTSGGKTLNGLVKEEDQNGFYLKQDIMIILINGVQNLKVEV